MKPFSDKDFLLNTKTAKGLFQSVAGLGIFEFQSGLSAEEIAANKTFLNITDLMLSDKQKHAAMRSFGVEEYYVTGEAGDYEKFQKWAETVPCLIGNPLYHQTHLELQRFFGIFDPLSPATAEQIWNQANAMITPEKFCARELLKKFNVELLCTKEDVTDPLPWHQKLNIDDTCQTKVIPAFDINRAINIGGEDFSHWLSLLEETCSREITDYFTFQSCLVERLLFFKSMGSKASFQSISGLLSNAPSFEQADAAFQKAKANNPLSPEEIACFQSHLLCFLAKKYQDYGFTMNLEVENATVGCNVITILEALFGEHKLPEIILSSKNTADYGVIVKKAVSSDIASKLHPAALGGQLYDEASLHTLLYLTAANGILPQFTGFSSGSDSFLSFPSHEYFRRVLCNFMGNLVESGEYPSYPDLLKKFAKDISLENAKKLF